MNLGLFIMWQNESSIRLILPAAVARDLLQKWASGYYTLKDAKTVTGTTVDGVEFAFSTQGIAYMHTFTMQMAMQQGVGGHTSGVQIPMKGY